MRRWCSICFVSATAHTITWQQQFYAFFFRLSRRRSFSANGSSFSLFFERTIQTNIQWPISDGSNGLAMSEGKINCTHKTLGNVVLVAITHSHIHKHSVPIRCACDTRARKNCHIQYGMPMFAVVQQMCSRLICHRKQLYQHISLTERHRELAHAKCVWRWAVVYELSTPNEYESRCNSKYKSATWLQEFIPRRNFSRYFRQMC